MVGVNVGVWSDENKDKDEGNGAKFDLTEDDNFRQGVKGKERKSASRYNELKFLWLM